MLISAMTKEELLAEAWRNGEEIARLRAQIISESEKALDGLRQYDEENTRLRAELAAYEDSESIEIITLRTELAETKEVATECMRARQDDAVEIARLREKIRRLCA
jgi:hypothetical protein